MLYLVHGEDDFGRAQWLAEIKQKVAEDEAMASLNTVTLDGQKLTAEELESNCAAVPFLADRRLVIVEGLASRLEPKDGQGRTDATETGRRGSRGGVDKRLVDYLAELPPTTDLVLSEGRRIAPTNPFYQAVEAAKGCIVALHPPRPDSPEMRDWLLARARHHGVQLAGDAVDTLLAFGGNNLRLLDVELAKLATYADGRVLTADDVHRLVASAREASIFDAMDAVGRRDTRRALRTLHAMLDEGESAQYLLYMVIRHVRTLIEARDALERGVPAFALADVLKVHRFVAQKAAEQARNFSLAGLLALHAQLVELDWASKTGRVEPEAALDTFVATLGRRA